MQKLMQVNLKSINEKIIGFIEYRNGLSEEEKKLEAGLLIEEIGLVNIDSAFDKVKSRIKSRTKINSWINVIIRVAAIFSLPLLAFTVWSLFMLDNTLEKTKSEITRQEIESPAGMRSHVVLPDGTDLWLNAGSKISYAIPFIQQNRQIHLTGEAFLKVVKNNEAPFIVNTGIASLKVLGTQFNVKAYSDEEQLEVALKEGSVEFVGGIGEARKASATLKANDFLTLNKKTGQVHLENKKLDKYISWHQNIMIFDDTPMPEVATILERWYGIKVNVVDKEINQYKFTTTFENESLFHVLELLQLSSPSISIKFTHGKVNKESNLASPSIVTITKKE